MDIGKSFTYVFDDEQWVQKVVIGALLLLASVIPIVNLFTALVVVGYSLRVLKNVSDGLERPLPQWDNWGEDWVKGVLFLLGLLIYALPALIVGGIAAIITAVVTSRSSEPSGAQFCILGLQCLTWIWGLLLALWSPAVMIRFAREGRFGAMFEFGALWSLIRANVGDYIVAVIISFVAQFLSTFGVILCVIGVFLTAFWALLVQVHVYGQVGAQAAPAAAMGGEEGFGGPTSYGELTEAPPSTPEEEEPKE